MMVLADTSVWINHFRRNDAAFGARLNASEVLMHPCVLGEIACGNLENRGVILGTLRLLPRAVTATGDEVLRLIETRKLWGCGIGWVDAQLIASALLTGCALWTLDSRLEKAALRAGVK